MPQPQPQLPTDQPQLHIVQPPPAPAKQPARIGPIIRDVAIVWVLTALGGFVVGVTGGAQRNPQQVTLIIGLSNIVLGTLAFTIAGCLAPPPRWRHLGFVALGAWLTSLVNVLFFHVTIPQWFGAAFILAIIMGIGGGLSYIFRRDTDPSV